MKSYSRKLFHCIQNYVDPLLKSDIAVEKLTELGKIALCERDDYLPSDKVISNLKTILALKGKEFKFYYPQIESGENTDAKITLGDANRKKAVEVKWIPSSVACLRISGHDIVKWLRERTFPCCRGQHIRARCYRP